MAIKAKDQVTVLDITDAYSVILTSEAYTFVGNTSGAPSGLSCSTQVVAYQGSTQCTKVTVTVTPPTGIKADITGNNGFSPTITFTTTATVTSSCEATIAVKIDDTTINKKFSFSVAKQGSTGSAGKGIKSTSITYQAGSSGTTAPTGTWASSPPKTTAAAPYMWTKTVITYTDNTTSTSYSVGSTPEGIQVGGRNLILNGKGNKKAGFFIYFPTVTDEYGELTLKSKKTYSSVTIDDGFLLGCRDYTVGEQVTWSYDIMYTAWNFPTGTDRAEFWMGQRYTSPPSGQTGTGIWRRVTQHDLPAVGVNGCELNKWYHVEVTITIPEQASSNIGTQSSIVLYNSNADVEASFTARFKNVKLERGNIATDWTPAPEDAIASVDVEYYLSTSSTSLAGGSWSTTAPAWVNGKYMWSRTVKTDGAGNKTYSPSQNGVCIAGAKGDTGSDGKGVKSIIEQYYKSTSATSLAGGSWSTTYPGWENGKYIWTRSAITYTDSTTPVYTTAICVTGQKGETGAKGDKGETGANGKSIGSVTNYYLATNASTGVTADKTSGWTTTVQSVSADKKYLWNYEVIKYTDNTVASTSAPCIIGAYGDKGNTGSKGDTGATGNGIKSITEHYAVSTSNSTAPTSWQGTPPAMTATDKYLWNYETIAYTSGSSVDTKKRVIGVYGDKGNAGSNGTNGTNGKSIGSVTNYYLATNASSNVTTSTSGWTTTVQSVSADKKYLWNYEVIKYTDGTTASVSSPCIIGAYGDTGDTGATGTSVTKTTRYYKLQDSTAAVPSVPTTNPPSGWTTTEPTYESGKSLYFVDVTVFSNGSVSYSAVSLSSSYKAASDVKNQVDEIKMNYRFDDDGQYIGKEGSDTTLRLINDAMEILVSGAAVTTVDTKGFSADQLCVNKIIIGDYVFEAIDDKKLRIS